MNIMCPCAGMEHSVNPSPHPCVWVLPWQAAAMCHRPVETIQTWRKSGRIDSRKAPDTGRWEVCNCETLTRSDAAEVRWSRNTG